MNRDTPIKTILLSALLALFLTPACMSLEDDPDDVGTDQLASTHNQGWNLNGWNLNGWNLNGWNLNGWNLNSLTSGGITTKGNNKARLVGSEIRVTTALGSEIGGKRLEGAVLTATTAGGKSIPLRIDHVLEDGDTYFYKLSWKAKLGWKTACGAAETHSGYAIAITGVFDDTATRQMSSDEFTLSCTNGVIAKCVTWGYKPWLNRFKMPMNQLLQTCTRMARADYCGDGVPSTENGTLIDIEDRFGIQIREGKTIHTDLDGVTSYANFEGAWGPNGPVCLGSVRLGNSACAGTEKCELENSNPAVVLPELQEFFRENGGDDCAAIAAIQKTIDDPTACNSFDNAWDSEPGAYILDATFGWDDDVGYVSVPPDPGVF